MKSLIPGPVRETSQLPGPASSRPTPAAQRALSPRPASVSSSTDTTHSRSFKPMSPPTTAPAVVASDSSFEAMMPALDRVKSPTPQPSTRKSRGSWLIGGPGGKGVSVSSKSGKEKDRKSGGHARATSVSSVDFGADSRDSLCCGDTIADDFPIADSASLMRPSPPGSPMISSHKSQKSDWSGAHPPVPQPPLTPPPSASATGKSFTVIAGSRTRPSPPRPPVQAERSYYSDPVTPPETASSLLHAIASGSSSTSPETRKHPFAVPTSPGPPVWHTPAEASGPTTPTAPSKTQSSEITRPIRSIHRGSSTSLRPYPSPSRDDIPSTISPVPESPLAAKEPQDSPKDPRSVLPPDADTLYRPSPSIANVMSEFIPVSPGHRLGTPEVTREPGPLRRQSERVEVDEAAEEREVPVNDAVTAPAPKAASVIAAPIISSADEEMDRPDAYATPPANILLPEVLRPRLAIELSWQNNLLPSVGFKSVPSTPSSSMKRSSTLSSLSSAPAVGLGKPPTERATLPRDSSRRTSLRYASQTAADVAAYGIGFIPLRGPRMRLGSLIEPYSSAPRADSGGDK